LGFFPIEGERFVKGVLCLVKNKEEVKKLGEKFLLKMQIEK